jgi:hypothetical protein
MTTQVPRNHQQRPWIQVDDRLVTYTRASNFAHSLSDSYALDMHHGKEIAIGIAENQWLLNKILAAQRPPEQDLWDGQVRTDWYDHNELVKWIEVAAAKAGRNVKSDYGTRMHDLTEVVDLGQELDWEELSPEESADLMSYCYHTDGMNVVDTERFCVNDEVMCAGTYDRRLTIQGKRRIADVKTGQVKGMEFEMQMAIYARSAAYSCLHEPILGENKKPLKEGCEQNLTAHSRTPLDVELDWGVVLRPKARTGEFTALKANLERGWRNVLHAVDIRAARKIELEEMSIADLNVPF